MTFGNPVYHEIMMIRIYYLEVWSVLVKVLEQENFRKFREFSGIWGGPLSLLLKFHYC